MTGENEAAPFWRLDGVEVVRAPAIVLGPGPRKEVRVTFVVPYERFEEAVIQDALDALNFSPSTTPFAEADLVRRDQGEPA